jgi:hypothetical protein
VRVRPNRSQLEATVVTMQRCADGFGADLELQVHHCAALPPGDDLIGAQPGERLNAFVAIPEALAAGERYRFEASLSGGPQGERVVLSRVRVVPAPASPEGDQL